jgi:ABC-type molybdenum transport system ATPase subunit/photorepair protein PhrA
VKGNVAAANIAAQAGKQVDATSQRNSNAITGLESVKRSQIEQSLSRDIRVEKFTLSYQSKVLFKDADLRVGFGHKYGLIGPNGAGKRFVQVVVVVVAAAATTATLLFVPPSFSP